MSKATLANQVVVLSGATSAIGRALCESLASACAKLILLGRDINALEQLAANIRDDAALATVCAIDLISDTSIQHAAAQLRRETDSVDILIHAAGTFEMGSQARADVSDFDLLYQTNVRGPYLLTQSLLPQIRTRPGQIVFLNSTVGLEAKRDAGPYSATQHALRALADSLRDEINADGVRVLSVYLGRTATARQEKIFQMENRQYRPELLMQPEDVAAMIRSSLCLPRTAEVTEIRMRPLLKSY